MNFEELPYDTVYIILSFLTKDDIVGICQVSKSFIISTVARTDRIWKPLYEKEEVWPRKKKYDIFSSYDDEVLQKSIDRRLGEVEAEKSYYRKFFLLQLQNREFNIERRQYRQDNAAKVRRKVLQERINKRKNTGSRIENVTLYTLGHSMVGKTCLLKRYLQHVRKEPESFPGDMVYLPTVLDDSSFLYMNTMERCVSCRLIDDNSMRYCLQSREWYDGTDFMRPKYFEETDVILLCFDLTNYESLDWLRRKWVPEILVKCPHALFIICGCKKDLREDKEYIEALQKKAEKYDRMYKKELVRIVSEEEGRDFAKEVKAEAYFETSAKTGENVKEVFEFAWKCILEPNIEEKSDRKCTIM